MERACKSSCNHWGKSGKARKWFRESAILKSGGKRAQFIHAGKTIPKLPDIPRKDNSVKQFSLYEPFPVLREDIYSFLPIPDLKAASQRIRQKLGTAVFRIKERTVHHGAFIDVPNIVQQDFRHARHGKLVFQPIHGNLADILPPHFVIVRREIKAVQGFPKRFRKTHPGSGAPREDSCKVPAAHGRWRNGRPRETGRGGSQWDNPPQPRPPGK